MNFAFFVSVLILLTGCFTHTDNTADQSVKQPEINVEVKSSTASEMFMTETPEQPAEDDTLYILLTFDGGEVLVSLADNVAAKSWYAQLPLTLPFEEFRSWHIICRVPDAISTEGMTVGNDPDIGDISLHIPWNALVFYYDEYSGNDSSVHIGRVETGLELLAVMEDKTIVTMEAHSVQ
jgi:hypothetical protein